MKAMRAVSLQDVPWVRTQWWRRAFDVRARDAILARLFKEQSMGKLSGGALLQFARVSRGRDEQRRHRLRRAQHGAGRLPHAGNRAEASYNTAAVVLAATNSFVWNRRFTFRVRGPLRAGEVACFVVVAIGTVALNDLVLLMLCGLFPALMGSFAASSERAQAGSHPGRDGPLVLRHAFLGVYQHAAVT